MILHIFVCARHVIFGWKAPLWNKSQLLVYFIQITCSFGACIISKHASNRYKIFKYNHYNADFIAIFQLILMLCKSDYVRFIYKFIRTIIVCVYCYIKHVFMIHLWCKRRWYCIECQTFETKRKEKMNVWLLKILETSFFLIDVLQPIVALILREPLTCKITI